MSLLFKEPKSQNPNGEKFVRIIKKEYKAEFTDELGKLIEERGDDIKDIKFTFSIRGEYAALVIFDHRKVKEQLEKEKAGISE